MHSNNLQPIQFWNSFDNSSVWTYPQAQHHHPFTTALSLTIVVIRNKSPLIKNWHSYWATHVLLILTSLSQEGQPTFIRSFPQSLWYEDHHHLLGISTWRQLSCIGILINPLHCISILNSNRHTNMHYNFHCPIIELKWWSDYWFSKQYP